MNLLASKLKELHDQAAAAGLHVRFHHAAVLVIAIPESAPEQQPDIAMPADPAPTPPLTPPSP